MKKETKPETKSARLSTWITPSLRESLDKLAEQRDRSLGYIINEALDQYTNRIENISKIL